MEFINFPESTHKALGLNYHFDPAGYIVLALKLDTKDIRELRRGGKLYIITGPGLRVPPPMRISLDNPFKPLSPGVTLGSIKATAEPGKIYPMIPPTHEKENPKGPSDDQ